MLKRSDHIRQQEVIQSECVCTCDDVAKISDPNQNGADIKIHVGDDAVRLLYPCRHAGEKCAESARDCSPHGSILHLHSR